jgi:hypothetical protein
VNIVGTNAVTMQDTIGLDGDGEGSVFVTGVVEATEQLEATTEVECLL